VGAGGGGGGGVVVADVVVEAVVVEREADKRDAEPGKEDVDETDSDSVDVAGIVDAAADWLDAEVGAASRVDVADGATTGVDVTEGTSDAEDCVRSLEAENKEEVTSDEVDVGAGTDSAAESEEDETDDVDPDKSVDVGASDEVATWAKERLTSEKPSAISITTIPPAMLTDKQVLFMVFNLCLRLLPSFRHASTDIAPPPRGFIGRHGRQFCFC
jgi:hypothetical protein